MLFAVKFSSFLFVTFVLFVAKSLIFYGCGYAALEITWT